MRIIFMGTPDFAASALSALLSAGQEVVLVVSQPDRPVGRHQVLTPTPVKVIAEAHNLPVFQPEKIKQPEQVAKLSEYNADVIVVVAYGQILSQEILSLPKLGCVNVHGSLLPKYRGAAPIQRAILEGEQETGITTMMMDAGMDTGDILLQRTLPIGQKDTGGTLFDKLAVLGAETLLETLDLLAAGNCPRKKQDSTKATYAPMLKKEAALVDFTRPAAELDCLIRAMNPWPTAFAFYGGKRLKIWAASPVEGEAAPGCLIPGAGLTVACGKGALQLDEVQPEGKRRQSGADFLRGIQARENLSFC